jgi:hypothetical protein
MGTPTAQPASYPLTDSLFRIASSDPEVQRLKHAEIAQRYKRKRKPFIFADRLVEELIHPARSRYGDTLARQRDGAALRVHHGEPPRPTVAD